MGPIGLESETPRGVPASAKETRIGLGGAPAGSAKLSKTRAKLGGDPAGPAEYSTTRPSGAPASLVFKTRASPSGAPASLAATGEAPTASSQGYASTHGRNIKT